MKLKNILLAGIVFVVVALISHIAYFVRGVRMVAQTPLQVWVWTAGCVLFCLALLVVLAVLYRRACRADEKAAEPGTARISGWATTAMWSGIAAVFSAFCLFTCEEPRAGYILPDVSEGFLLFWVLAVLCSALAVLLAVIASIRIWCSHRRVCGFRRVLGGLVLAVLATVVWIVALSR